MSKKISLKVSNYIIVSIIVVLIAFLILVYTLDGILRSYLKSQGIEEKKSSIQLLDEERLNSAEKFVKSTKYVPLDMDF